MYAYLLCRLIIDGMRVLFDLPYSVHRLHTVLVAPRMAEITSLSDHVIYNRVRV